MRHIKYRQIFYMKKNILVCFFLCLFFLSISYTEAATLSVSSAQTQVSVGETVRYKILLNTQSKVINTVEGVISFDPTMVEVVSVSSSNSILDIWIENPSFSNSTGKISFSGGIIPPGYIGSSGEVFSVTMKAKKEGSAGFKVQDVSILQNDGSGTDMYSGAGSNTNVSLLVIQKPAVDVVSKKPVEQVLVKPVIKPVVQTVITKTISSLKDKIVQDRLSIIIKDSTVEIGGIEEVDVAYANISVGQASSTKIIPVDGKIIYVLPELASGSHEIQAVLFDAKGNSFEIKDTIVISTELVINVLKQKKSYVVGDLIHVQGLSSVVNSFITLSVISPDGSTQKHQTKSLEDGSFEFNIAAEKEGVYAITGEIPNIVTSNVLNIFVELSPIQKSIFWIDTYQNVLLGSAILLVMFLLASMWMRRKKCNKKRYVPNMEKLEVDIDKTLETLKSDAENYLVHMDQIARFRNLTEEEKVLYMHCRSILK